MAAMSPFESQVRAWTAKVKRRMRFVVIHACNDLLDDMQTPVGAGGRLPVLTGRLRESLRVRVGTAAATGATAYKAVLPNYKLGNYIMAAYTVPYARIAEYGSRNRTGRLFRAGAVRKWPSLVEQAVLKARRVK